MVRLLPLVVLLGAVALCAACTPFPAASPSVRPSDASATPFETARATATATLAATPVPSGPPQAAVSLRGATFAMDTDPDMRAFFPDRGSLVAISSKDGPAPFASKVLLADPPRGPWRSVYASDAMYQNVVVANGFVHFFEYREQGGGAFSQKLVQVDLPSGRAQVLDGHSLSAATYRGGGGGPPRPTASVVFGNGLVAWVRLVEGTGGSVTGELRIGLPHRAADAQLVARSDLLIRPIAIVEAATLVYVISAERGVELRARDVATGAERILAVGQISAAGIVPFRIAADSGSWIAWVEDSSTPTSTVRAIDLKSGATRDIPLGQSYCPMLTANDRYLALNCSAQQGPPRMVLIDTRSWTELPVAQTTSNGPFFLAAGGMTELLWQDRVEGRERVIRFVPTAQVAAPADGPFRDLVPHENAALGYRLSLPATYRLAHSVAEQGNVGTEYYTPRTEEEMREACRAGGFGLQQATDIQVVVRARGAVVSPVDAVRHTLYTATKRLAVFGLDAARIVNMPSGETAYYVISANDRLYEIRPAVGSQPAPPELTSSGFDQIVSTFTAIPIGPLSAAPPRRALCGT